MCNFIIQLVYVFREKIESTNLIQENVQCGQLFLLLITLQLIN